MELDEIATFVQVVRSRGFSAAASSLHVPKSTISRRIARLEERLGSRLIQRTTRTMRVTEEGRVFYERVAGAVDNLKSAAIAVREGSERPRGVLRVSAPVDLAHALLAPLVAEFTQTHEEVEVQVSLSARRVDLVEEGFDLALRAGAMPDSSLIARRLANTTFHLVASPDYLTRRGRLKKPTELSAHECIRFRPVGPESLWDILGPRGGETRVHVHGRCSADDFSFLLALAREGAGIAALPAFHTRGDIGEGRLERVLPKHHIKGGALHLVYPTAQQLPMRTVAFRDFLVERFAQLQSEHAI